MRVPFQPLTSADTFRRRADYVGIDLQKKESQICILSEWGQLRECRIRTEPQRFAEVLGGRPRARILLEASTESEWVARSLEGLGHEVVVANPNFAPMYATRTRKVMSMVAQGEPPGVTHMEPVRGRDRTSLM
jgi:hypothetical protein